MSERLGFLGPVGTFTHEAALTVGVPGATLVPLGSIADVLEGVADQSLNVGIVPIENAIEGTVSATIDGLLFDHHLLIQHEVVLPISLHVMARAGVAIDEVRVLQTYSHAAAQCRRYLSSLKGVHVEHVASTADAARLVAASDQPVAAIASEVAATTYGLAILQRDVEDYADNETRFVVVGRDHVSPPSGHDRTAIVCFQDADRPGSLYGILGRFAARDLNLTKLESRPTKRGLGEYCFVIEFDGHLADDVVADCLADLQAHLTRVKFLGSYPVTGAVAASRRDEVVAARHKAQEWIGDLRALISE
jgi:prephenate dehydratase